MLAVVRKVAKSNTTVLVRGETGTGKELIAGAIHHNSHRAARNFVKVNRAALQENLLESELFGHEKGAFTGADKQRVGRFEQADGGTLFLDEVGDMSANTQAKILRVLQEHEFERLGGTRTIRVDVRLIAATNRDLPSMVEAGTFREDLYYRLNVVTIRVPPLRERKEDIAPLVRHFVEKYRRRYKGGLDRVPDDVMERFHAYDWPGNVRELENLVRRLVVLKEPAMVLGELNAVRNVPLGIAREAGVNAAVAPPSNLHAPLPEDAPLKEVGKRAARIAEREAILRALMRTGWNKRKAAKRLQISYKALLYKIKECEIVDPRNAAIID